MSHVNYHVSTIEPLVEVKADNRDPQYLGHEAHYVAECRDCGPLPSLVQNQSLYQAGLLKSRHLAEHLKVLSQEIAEAAR